MILLFDAGALKKAVVIQAIGGGYHLMCDNNLLQAQRGGDRVFKTIDSSVENARKIGFKKIEVHL